MLCEFSQESSFKIKVNPELKHPLKPTHFPLLEGEAVQQVGGQGGGAGSTASLRLKEDGSARIPGTTATASVRRGKGSGQAMWGRGPKITKNLKLQGEVEGSAVASNGELL